ncbi:MAG: 2-dehydropantoate 2-reductase [Burkholderiaceae bacterium]
MRILVYGVGGVGGYFGGRLAEAGHDVTFVARGATLQAMQDEGLRVDSINGDFRIDPVQVTDDPRTVGEVETILVCVKAWQVSEVARAIKPIVTPQTAVVPMQNGIEAPDRLIEVLGREPVLGGLCGVHAAIRVPGYIVHDGAQPRVSFGELDDSRSERVDRLLAAFQQAHGLRADIPDNIQSAMWAKFLMITAFSGIGSITRVPIGEFRREGGSRQLMVAVMEEIASLARARGVPLPQDIVASTMAGFDKVMPTSTASMQRDMMAGRPSELDAQTGAVVRIGRELGIATPVNGFIYDCLLPQERLARD